MDNVQNLIEVKKNLAKKYARLSRTTTSTPKRKRMMNRANAYVRQAETFERNAEK